MTSEEAWAIIKAKGCGCGCAQMAETIARGLEENERAVPVISAGKLDQATLDELCKFKPGRMTLVASPRQSLPEPEILTRAREAAIAEMEFLDEQDRKNIRENGVAPSAVRAAARALRDLAKPLSEVVPAVDPDLVEARKVAIDLLSKSQFGGQREQAKRIERGEKDDDLDVQIPLAAIRRGRELEREAQS